jgi:hypothetical protein
MRWVGHVGEERKVYRVSVGEPQRKRPLERPRHRWEHAIKMYLSEIGCGSVEWIQLTQDRGRWQALVNMVMKLQVLVPRI